MNLDDEIKAAFKEWAAPIRADMLPPRFIFEAGYLAASNRPKDTAVDKMISDAVMYGTGTVKVTHVPLKETLKLDTCDSTWNDKPQAVMPSFEEFCSWYQTSPKHPNMLPLIHDYFASRVKPVVWPSDEEILEACGSHDKSWTYETFNHAIAWLKERVK